MGQFQNSGIRSKPFSSLMESKLESNYVYSQLNRNWNQGAKIVPSLIWTHFTGLYSHRKMLKIQDDQVELYLLFSCAENYVHQKFIDTHLCINSRSLPTSINYIVLILCIYTWFLSKFTSSCHLYTQQLSIFSKLMILL